MDSENYGRYIVSFIPFHVTGHVLEEAFSYLFSRYVDTLDIITFTVYSICLSPVLNAISSSTSSIMHSRSLFHSVVDFVQHHPKNNPCQENGQIAVYIFLLHGIKVVGVKLCGVFILSLFERIERSIPRPTYFAIR